MRYKKDENETFTNVLVTVCPQKIDFLPQQLKSHNFEDVKNLYNETVHSLSQSLSM